MRIASLHIYVAHLGAKCLIQMRLAADGTLTEVERWPLSGFALPIAVRQDGCGLYVGTFSEDGASEVDRIDSFARDRISGQLTSLGSVNTPGRLTHISTDKKDGFVLGASYFADCIVSHPILPDGRANEVEFSLPTGRKAHHIQTDARNRYVLIPNLGDSQIMQLRFNETDGTFAPNEPPLLKEPAGAGCRHIAHHPNGCFAYLINERDGSVVSFAYDPDSGTLSAPLQRETCLRTPVGDPWGAQILVSAEGTQLFVSERRTNVLARWRIDPESGYLSERHIIDVGRNPRSFELVPGGRQLLLAALDDDAIETYRIDRPDGVPELMATTNVASGPTWIAAIVGTDSV